MPVCLNCGHNYKTYRGDVRKTVKGCSKCTKLFPDNAFDDMIKEFFR